MWEGGRGVGGRNIEATVATDSLENEPAKQKITPLKSKFKNKPFAIEWLTRYKDSATSRRKHWAEIKIAAILIDNNKRRSHPIKQILIQLWKR